MEELFLLFCKYCLLVQAKGKKQEPKHIKQKHIKSIKSLKLAEHDICTDVLNSKEL